MQNCLFRVFLFIRSELTKSVFRRRFYKSRNFVQNVSTDMQSSSGFVSLTRFCSWRIPSVAFEVIENPNLSPTLPPDLRICSLSSLLSHSFETQAQASATISRLLQPILAHLCPRTPQLIFSLLLLFYL